MSDNEGGTTVATFFIFNYRRLLSIVIIKIGFTVLLLGLFIPAYHAGHESLTTHSRVKLISDSAGTVTYTITFLAISVTILATRIFTRKKLFFSFFHFYIECLSHVINPIKSRNNFDSLYLYLYLYFLM